ncbi:hypothetical protein DBZ36_16850 [Alginatibacterium sediminis]|uniref:Retropepsin-like aspartic endopeptidase domain-containing protein n=1 Tax=Alginatibacterium sediminis TaxID=2164068 RepID=A0A420E7D0_9ALTE|nr:RimK/LysX family protein [Alginatibacterium sediminis]RKF14328.1 hypothetical protein DBZ36_16850 [Alginatibacterium sediminis]
MLKLNPIFAGLTMMVLGGLAQASETSTVGALEMIQVEEAQLEFLTRIDTGAASTSIHAINLRLESGDEIIDQDGMSEAELQDKVKPEMESHIGQKLVFSTENEKGVETEVKAVISDVIGVRNSQGKEYRYKVKLDLRWQDDHKEVAVNLRDRSKMEYKLLIGRDWLEGDYLVDVERNKDLD